MRLYLILLSLALTACADSPQGSPEHDAKACIEQCELDYPYDPTLKFEDQPRLQCFAERQCY